MTPKDTGLDLDAIKNEALDRHCGSVTEESDMDNILALIDQVHRLRNALEPFARPLWVSAHEGWAADEQIKTHCTVADVRRAAAALADGGA